MNIGRQIGNIVNCNNNSMNINGVTVIGRTMTINSDGAVIVDGKRIEGVELGNPPTINITVDGPVDSINCSQAKQVTVNGDCKDLKVSQGDVRITRDILGDAKVSQGTINCSGKIKGKATVSQGTIIHK